MRQVGFCRGGHWPPVFLCDQVLVISLYWAGVRLSGYEWTRRGRAVGGRPYGGAELRVGREEFLYGFFYS